MDKEISLDEELAEELEPEILALDGEDLDESEEEEVEAAETDEEKEERRKRRRKYLKIAGIGIAGLAACIYLGFVVYFSNHFYFRTSVNGADQSMKSVTAAEGYMEQQVTDYVLTIRTSDGTTEQIVGADISMNFEKGDELKSLVKSQNPWLWPVSLFQKQELVAPVGVTYDEEKLAVEISKLNCMKEENQVAPVSATPEYNGTAFEILAEKIGSKINQAVFEEKIKEYLNGFVSELDLVEEACYVEAKYKSDSPEVIAACEQMNQFLTAKITYDFGTTQEVVDRDVIKDWLVVSDDMTGKLSASKIKAYIEELAEKYDTYQKERTFTSGDGRTVSVSGGDYGWMIDQDAEYKALVANLKNSEVVEREPEYAKRAETRSGNEWGDTYVEVDLARQRVYLIINGKVLLDTPCVTGNVNNGWYTPQGVYSIKNRAKNVTLRGPKKDGKYEWESPVTFWMPFNGSIGLHDASWQTSFGNPEGYLVTGSRGCVNLQYDAAEMIFNNVSIGTPVVCHF